VNSLRKVDIHLLLKTCQSTNPKMDKMKNHQPRLREVAWVMLCG
jgi:hypothetical protein